MTRSLNKSTVTRFAIAAALAIATLVVAANDASAQNRNRRIGIGIGPIQIDIGDPNWGPGGPGPVRPKPDRGVEYVVQEYNPITGGVYQSRTFRDRSEANSFRDNLARAHWVKWRFAGINEPLRYRRFNSGTLAQLFIDNDGPSRSGALGIAILTNETRALPTRVTLSTRPR